MSESCEKKCEDLVALAWGGLEGEAREGLKRHVESCGGCRSELEKLDSLRETVRSVTRIEPTGGFHARVTSRVKQRATPRGLPAASSGQRRGPDRAASSGQRRGPDRAAGPASRRLAVLAERDRPRVFTPRQRMIALGLSVATAAAVMLAFQAWKIAVRVPARPGPVVIDTRTETQAEMARRRERLECTERRRRRVEVAVAGCTAVDVAGVLDDGEVVLTGIVDIERHERCLMAFRASDWAEYVRHYGNPLAAGERRRFRALTENRRTATVRAGRLEVPQGMYDRYVGESSVVLLRLKGRAEIWSREAFGIYRRVLPTIEIDPKEVSALEPPVFGRAAARAVRPSALLQARKRWAILGFFGPRRRS